MSTGAPCTAFASIMALALVGCGEPSAPNEGAAQSGAVPGMADRAAPGAQHLGHGTLNSIDRSAGTVNISHEPVESAGWPAMTMNFRLADPDAAAELTPGQRVEFRFTTDDGGTVTAIEAR
jgi:Cu/Ag efflux protein CusF